MILTVTMNPSVDISYPLNEFKVNEVNRCSAESKTAGGKGLNVSRVIQLMDEEVLATGIIGGFLGKFIQKDLDSTRIPHHFYEIDEESRNCIAILHDGKQTEILETGPTITKEQESEFFFAFQDLLQDVDVVTISGSLPKGIDPLFYNQLLDVCSDRGIRVLLDTSGITLEESLKNEHKPYLIKPNIGELKQLIKTDKKLNKVDLVTVLEEPIFKEIPVIVVSMGKEGAFVKWDNHYYDVRIPTIEVVNPVGSGDATIAGLAIAINKQLSPEETLKTAMTTGMLNTMEEKTGFVDKTQFDTYFNQVSIEKITNKRVAL